MNGIKAYFPTAGLVVLGVVLATAIGQTGRDPGGGRSSPDPIIRELQRTVREHAVRIEQLEAREARQDPTFLDATIVEAPTRAPRPAPGPAPNRIMILDSIEPLEADASNDEEIERLQKEVESLERTVDQMERQTASMSGRGSGGYRRGYKSTSTQRQRASHGELAADYKTKLRKKKGELKRLEREINEPKQIVYGHWQSTIFTLETTRDQSRVLDRIPRGGTLTWDGRRLRHDGGSSEWVVTRVEAVDPASVQ